MKKKFIPLSDKEKKLRAKNRSRLYYQENNLKVEARKKIYIDNNREKVNASVSRYKRNRRANDPMYRLKLNIAKRVTKMFKQKWFNKGSGTFKMVGVDIDTLRSYIENKFTKGMNWGNYGEWHIDHEIPLASAKTEDDLERLCHYRNLQPLWSEDNKEKSDRIDTVQVSMII